MNNLKGTEHTFRAPSGKRGQIPDEKGKIARLSGKRAWDPDRTTKKRDTPIGVSLVMDCIALSREGQLKNRGRPWPREREVVNEKRDIRWMSRSEQS